MAELARLRSDLGAFADAIGWPLTPWQLRALGLDVRTTAIVAPRQSGKSRSLAVLALWWAYRQREQRVLIVSAGEEAARRLLAEVRRIATGSPLLAGSVLDEQAGLVTLSNGSEVRSVPASERQVRGWTVDLLLLDEAALIADGLLLDAALPTTAARPEARVVMASSATVAAGAFYDHAIRGEQGSEHVRTFRWLLADCEWIAPSVIEAARESMSELRFAAEYEGVFASGADALFNARALDRATADYVPAPLDALRGPARLLAGVDWGATFDRSALVAIGRLPVAGQRVYGVACEHRWPAGESIAHVVAEIAGSPAHFDTVSMETNGLGHPCAELLTARLRQRPRAAGGGEARRGQVLIEEQPDRDAFEDHFRRERARAQADPGFATRPRGVHTTAELKAATYSALRLLIDQGRLVLPASAEELRRELLMLRVDLAPGGGERIEASAGHDDLADALMLAASPYRDPQRRWRTLLGYYAEPARALPEASLPAAAGRVETVETGAGLAVPRVPIWQSVRGHELTVPVGLDLDDGPPVPTRLLAARETVRAALEEPEPKEAP